MTEDLANLAWEKKFEAEVRSLYFAELAAQFTRRKQLITGLTFFLSSGAAASVVAKAPDFVPIALSVITAIASAYSVSTGLDRRIATLVKLHQEWHSLASDYDRLWRHWFDEDSERTFYELVKRGRDASVLAVTEAPFKKELMDRVGETVYSMYDAAA